MAQFEGRRGRLEHLPAIGFVGLLGAWLAADFFRMGATPAGVGSRGVLMVLTTVAALIVGWIAGLQRNLRVGALVLSIASPVLGMVLGVATIALTSSNSSEASLGLGAIDGLFAGAVFLPAVLVVLIANRHVGRARSNTIVDQSDRRAAYVAAAFALAIGAPIAIVGCEDARWLGIPLDVTLGISVLASIALLVAFALDCSALSMAHQVALGWETLEPQDPNQAFEDSPSHDLGLGDGVLGRVQRADAYRTKPRVENRLRGEPALALSALRRSAFCSGTGFVIASAAMVLSLALAKHAPQGNVDPWLAERLRAPKVIDTGLDPLPLSCGAYFAMAGGCVERAEGPERAHLSTRLDLVRTAWVTHKNRADVEASCTAALREALDHVACVTENTTATPQK